PSGQQTLTDVVGENGTAPVLTWDDGTSNGRSRKSGYFDIRSYPQSAPDTTQPVSYNHRELIGFRRGSRGFTTIVEQNTGANYSLSLAGITLTVSDPIVALPGDWRDWPDVPFIGPDGNPWLAYPAGNEIIALQQRAAISGTTLGAYPSAYTQGYGGPWCWDQHKTDPYANPAAWDTYLGREQ